MTLGVEFMLTTSGHRAAWDTTISAPKSVSLGALVGGDGRIREVYRVTISVRTGRGTSSLSNKLLQTAV